MKSSKSRSGRRRWTPAQRQQFLADFHQSKTTQRDFANSNGVGLSTLVKWLRVEREAVPAKVKFQEVRLPTTLRTVKTATINDRGAICWAGSSFYESIHRPNLEILDRFGDEDSIASGLIYGVMINSDPAKAVNYGAARDDHPGDISIATVKEAAKNHGTTAHGSNAESVDLIVYQARKIRPHVFTEKVHFARLQSRLFYGAF